ncbi:MAG: hypothetical protein ACKVQT_03665 [Burkholderiales bacterium]
MSAFSSPRIGELARLPATDLILVTPTVAVTAFAAGTQGVSEIDKRPVNPDLG